MALFFFSGGECDDRVVISLITHKHHIGHQLKEHRTVLNLFIFVFSLTHFCFFPQSSGAPESFIAWCSQLIS